MVQMIFALARSAAHRRIWSNRSGQAAVEMALVIPIFLLLVVGLVEFSRAWNIKRTVADAARAGARTAVLANPSITEDSIRSMILSVIEESALDPTDATVSLTGVGGETGTLTQIEVSYPFELALLSRLTAGAVSSSFDMSSSMVMRHE